jgi:hypothetical protein
MADTTIEFEGLRFKVHDMGDGTYSIANHDMGGGTGVADSSLEIQGIRLLAHDNGDGTFSIVTTSTTGAGDLTVEHEGIRLKVHPTGGTQTIAGISTPVYALNIFGV